MSVTKAGSSSCRGAPAAAAARSYCSRRVRPLGDCPPAGRWRCWLGGAALGEPAPMGGITTPKGTAGGCCVAITGSGDCVCWRLGVRSDSWLAGVNAAMLSAAASAACVGTAAARLPECCSSAVALESSEAVCASALLPRSARTSAGPGDSVASPGLPPASNSAPAAAVAAAGCPGDPSCLLPPASLPPPAAGAPASDGAMAPAAAASAGSAVGASAAAASACTAASAAAAWAAAASACAAASAAAAAASAAAASAAACCRCRLRSSSSASGMPASDRWARKSRWETRRSL